MDSEQIIQEIRGLPDDARRALIERVVREFGGAASEPAMQPCPSDDAFLGLLADEPDLADQIRQMASDARHEGREVVDGDENPS
jgi:hypothetical protein